MFLGDQRFDDIFNEFHGELKNAEIQELQKPHVHDLKVNSLSLILEDILYQPQNPLPQKWKEYDLLILGNHEDNVYKTFCKYFPSALFMKCDISCPSIIYPFALYCAYDRMQPDLFVVGNSIVNKNKNKLRAIKNKDDIGYVIEELSSYLQFLFEIKDYSSINISINLHLFNQIYHYCDLLFLSRYMPYGMNAYDGRALPIQSRYIPHGLKDCEEDDDIDINYLVLTHLSTLFVKWHKFKNYYPQNEQDEELDQLVNFVNTSNGIIDDFTFKMGNIYYGLDMEDAKRIYKQLCDFDPYRKLLASLITYLDRYPHDDLVYNCYSYYDYFREIHERPNRKPKLKDD